MLTWQIGKVKITRVLELENAVTGPESGMPQATSDAICQIPWLAPHFADADGRLLMSFHGFVVETEAHRIVVDTCIGADKERGIPELDNLASPFLERMEGAGFDRHSIDFVVCTHLHLDHVGWNTRLVNGMWEPTFPNARYLIGRQEFERWRDQQTDAIHSQVFLDSVQPVWEAGLIELVETDHHICDEVSLVPTCGHTEGHVSVLIRSLDEKALITGDFIHHPCQLAHPDWGHMFDDDGAEAARTRNRQFAIAADNDIFMIGSHFRTPSAGWVRRTGTAYRLDCD